MRRWLAAQRARFDRGGRAAVLWALRLTVAATASYLVATALFPQTVPLLAPLTALLVVQVTPVSLLASGLDRVISVVSGVALAVAFSTVVPLAWWSLGLLIAVSILIGQALRLRSNLIEVAISAMLVLGVGSLGAESAAWERIAETLAGAAVGIAVNLLVPPKVATADAGAAIDQLAERIARLLRRAADELADLPTDGRGATGFADLSDRWLDDARVVTHGIPTVGEALLRAEQSRRLNVRAVGTPDVGPGLRQGLEAVEHSAVAVRGLFRTIHDAAYDDDWLAAEVAPDIVSGMAEVLRELAAAIDEFGALVRVEAEPQQVGGLTHVHGVQAALDGLHEARARLEDVLSMAADPGVTELHAALLTTVRRLLVELDLDVRVRRELRLHRDTHRPRPGPSAARPRPPRPPAGRPR